MTKQSPFSAKAVLTDSGKVDVAISNTNRQQALTANLYLKGQDAMDAEPLGTIPLVGSGKAQYDRNTQQGDTILVEIVAGRKNVLTTFEATIEPYINKGFGGVDGV